MIDPIIIPHREFKADFNVERLIQSFNEQNISSVPKIDEIIKQENIEEYLLVVDEPKAFKDVSSNLLKYGVFGLNLKGEKFYLDEFIYLNKPSKRVKINKEVMDLQGRYQFIKEEYVYPAGQLILSLHDTFESQRRESFTSFFCDDESEWLVFLQDWNLFTLSNVYKSINEESDLKKVHKSVSLMFKPVLNQIWDYIKYEFNRTPLDMNLDNEVKELATLHKKATTAMDNLYSKVHQTE